MAFHHPAVLLTTFDLSSQVFTLLACTRRVASKCVQQLSRCTGNSNWNHFSARLIVPPKIIGVYDTCCLLVIWQAYFSTSVGMATCHCESHQAVHSIGLCISHLWASTYEDWVWHRQNPTQTQCLFRESKVDHHQVSWIHFPIILSHTPLFKNRTPFIEKKSEKCDLWPSVQLQALLWILSAPGAAGHRHPPNLRPFRRDEKKRKGLPRPLSTLPWPDMRCTKAMSRSLYYISYKIDYNINRFMYTCIYYLYII